MTSFTIKYSLFFISEIFEKIRKKIDTINILLKWNFGGDKIL